MEYQVIVPNLERRTDRWLLCLGALLGQGVSPERIIRFCAHDGRDYSTVEEARDAALRQFDSPFLQRVLSNVPSNFCWRWTYYNILHLIASSELRNPRIPILVLIDDTAVRFTYREIENHLDRVTQESDEFCMIQYNIARFGDKRFPLEDLLKLNEATGFQRGIGGMGDRATIFTKTGALKFLSYLDATDIPRGPEQAFWHFAHDCDQSGCYSMKGRNWDPLGNPFIDGTQDRTGETPDSRHRVEVVDRCQYMVLND